MKKLFVVMLVLFIAASAFAQSAGSFSAGGKLGYALGFHDPDQGSMDSQNNFTFGAFGGYTIIDRLTLQLELDFALNQGLSESGYTVEYNSLDIPVLVKYAFIETPVIAGILAGPQLSIPIGDIKSTLGDASADGFTFGLVAGGFVGYPLGPGRILADIRYLFDFNNVKTSDVDLFARRALIFAIGYELSF